MKHFIFRKKPSVFDKTQRIIVGILFQVPWFSFFSFGIWYAQTNTISFLENYFKLWQEKRAFFILKQQTQAIKDNLSLINPLKLTDYISSLTASTFAKAKVTTLEQTIHFLSYLFESILSFIWFLGIIYVFIRSYRYYREKTVENNVANLVVEKLIPILERIENNQKAHKKK